MHGGNIYDNNIEYDFSVNVNPLGIMPQVYRALADAGELLTAYPEYSYRKLRTAIGKSHHIDPDSIVPGNGASELLMAVCHSFRINRALLVAPCFSGYERALNTIGAEIEYFNLGLADINSESAENSLLVNGIKSVIDEISPDILIVGNPGNPAGNLIPADEILHLCNCYENMIVLVDECFMELTGVQTEYSLLGDEKDNLIVVRAFTKSFAIPGVRLGYAVTKKHAALLSNHLPEWNVSVPADFAGQMLLKSDFKTYLEKSVDYIQEERTYLEDNLCLPGLTLYKSAANYILFFYDGDKNIYEELLKRRILIRNCADYKGLGEGFYRAAVRTRPENDVFIRCMREILL